MVPVSYTHLLPEIPYDIDKVAEVVENRFAAGKKFSIIAVAEGAISKEDAKLKKKQYKAKLAERRYPSVAYEIAAALEEKTNREIRVTVPGHTQRGGAPCAYDRVLATRVGAYAAELILNKEYGYMAVSYTHLDVYKRQICGLPLAVGGPS